MANQKSQVLTPWIGSGKDSDLYRPQLWDDHFTGAGWVEGQKFEDVTGQDMTEGIPEPNLYTVEIESTDATLASIGLDNSYLVLWSEEIPDAETP